MANILGVCYSITEILFLTLKSFVLCFIPYKWKSNDVSNDVVLITGGGSGIGRILAQKFASLGSQVVIMDVDEAGMAKTCQLIGRSGRACRAYKCDVSNRALVYTTAEKIKEDFGFVSIVINNAGITGSARRISELNDERTIMTMNVNAMSHFWVTKAFLPDMMKESRGHLVYIASYAGTNGSVALADYCASKFAVIGLAESVSLELIADEYNDIHVTCIAPWLINTGLFAGARNPYIPALEPRYAAQRIMQAILANERVVCLPRLMYVLNFLKAILPTEAAIKLYMLMEGYTFMEGFTGRKKTIIDDNENEVSDEPVNNLNNKCKISNKRRSSKKGDTSKTPVVNINGGNIDGSFSIDD